MRHEKRGVAQGYMSIFGTKFNPNRAICSKTKKFKLAPRNETRIVQESLRGEKKEKSLEKFNLYLIFDKYTKWKASPNDCLLEEQTFGLGASCSKLETLIYIEVIAMLVVEYAVVFHKKFLYNTPLCDCDTMIRIIIFVSKLH